MEQLWILLSLHLIFQIGAVSSFLLKIRSRRECAYQNRWKVISIGWRVSDERKYNLEKRQKRIVPICVEIRISLDIPYEWTISFFTSLCWPFRTLDWENVLPAQEPLIHWCRTSCSRFDLWRLPKIELYLAPRNQVPYLIEYIGDALVATYRRVRLKKTQKRIENKFKRFSIPINHRLDKCLTLLLWTQQHRSVIFVELISINLLKCCKTRYVVNSVSQTPTTGHKEARLSVVTTSKLSEVVFGCPIDVRLGPTYWFDWDKTYPGEQV